MIYVTVGGHIQGFDRLVRKMDEIASRIEKEVIIQYGSSKYIPRNCRCFDYVMFDENEEYIKNSEIVVSHAGAGTILLARKHMVPIIVVPRRKIYKEHYTGHQMELCKAIIEKGIEDIFVVYEIEKLELTIQKVLSLDRNNIRFLGNNGAVKISEELKDFIQTYYGTNRKHL